jgi:hypothetical protein
METNVSAGLPAAPKSPSAPEGVKSGEGARPRIIISYDESKDWWSIERVEGEEALKEELRKIGEPCDLDYLLGLFLDALNGTCGLIRAEQIHLHEKALDVLFRAAGLEELVEDPAPGELKSGQGVKEVRIDLSGLHEVLGAPRRR